MDLAVAYVKILSRECPGETNEEFPFILMKGTAEKGPRWGPEAFLLIIGSFALTEARLRR